MSQNKLVEEEAKELMLATPFQGINIRLTPEDWEKLYKRVATLLQQERQTSQEREREIVEAILAVKIYAGQTDHSATGQNVYVVQERDIKTIAQKYNITLTNPNKD